MIGDITAPGESPLAPFSAFRLLLYHNLATSHANSSVHLHCQSEPQTPRPAATAPPADTLSQPLSLSLVSLPVLLCRPHTASSWAQRPGWHPARPALPRRTGKTLVLSPHTPVFPAPSFHRSARGPLLRLPPSLFCTTAEIHTLKACPPTTEKNNATSATAGGANKALIHLNARLLCNHTEGEAKLSINNVTSRHQGRYQVHGAGAGTATVSPEMFSILYLFMN